MGASAQVYLADDVRLRRRVALKMLHDALAGDNEFLRRFRAEARAAAALSHPNVMAVYDWGDDGTAFIVTEYLAGGSLRALLDRGELLTPSQALTVGLEATRALDYAHRRGFVHRDIKPANLLFGEEQRLRIADFGLARALAEAAWTEPQGAIMGTARYASPELAKGEQLTGKADVYALALVMIEAVTGEVPFVADTTLGTLMARVDRQLEVPDALGPLQGVLARAGHPDPEVRLDARALAAGLLRAAKSLPKPAPLPLAGALPPAGEVFVDSDPTIHAPVGGVAADEAAEGDLTADDLDLDPPDWVNQSDPSSAFDDAAEPDAGADDHPSGASAGEGASPSAPLIDLREPDPVALTVPLDAAPAWVDLPAPAAELADRVVVPDAGSGGLGGVDASGPDAGEARSSVAVLSPPDELTVLPDPNGDDVEPPATEAGPDGGRRRRRWPWVLLVVALLAGAGGAAAAVTGRGPNPFAAPVTLPVPNLVGRTQADAEAVAEAAGWKVTTRTERRDGTTKGEVLATNPKAGTRLAEGKPLALTVSAGQTIVDVPTDLVGKTIEQANEELFFVGLGSSSDDRVYDEDAAEGVVMAVADGTPERLEKGGTVALVVSKGPEPRVVPSGLRGSPEASAKESLAALRLEPAVTRSYSDDVPEGVVISVLPREGSTVPRGSTVTLEVSRGPNLVAVPSIRSASSIAEAVAILKNAGLTAGSISGPATGSPSRTSPAAGTMVRRGSTVNIVLA
ncbi:MAG: PASTA domain-containing protein [Actinobacteria bacterium]|nr:PASTA domain-containing protein [Actinomycetota bacterium]